MSTRAPRRTKPLLRPPATDAESLLFCFPYPGTGASLYHAWPRRISGTEVCPVQLPGRESRMREPPWLTYADLAGQLVEELAEHLDRPFAFFGPCGAAYIAVETAFHLAARPALSQPEHLFVSSAYPPHQSHQASILSVPDSQLRSLIVALIRARGGEPHDELVELAIDPLRADVEAHRRYDRMEPARLSTPITVLGWSGDENVRPEELRDWSEYGVQVAVHVLDGGHWSFLSAPAELRELIGVALTGASRPRPAFR